MAQATYGEVIVRGMFARKTDIGARVRRDDPSDLETPAGGNEVPRKPNYKFERYERERLKAEKKAARLQAKADRRASKSGEDGATDGAADEAVGASEDSEDPNSEIG